ncbi:hypothetical protein C3941_09185 [Kaistia algarum]|uniref:hypothetical protein n=1 Tax=Kaistia algarum TaxID=2083279 RepID=UPI000CE89AAB|nr:hypothetical protein [Kaistia algarum]MCX5512232.1 hypothetical protein [Kaistia algarum]PPE80327.1 hypothetical protein C3941_09185 [Kaistia algarum]
MAKEIRSSRTSIRGSGISTTSPTVQTQVVPRAIPEFRSTAEGLDGLSNAFGQFFGAASGALSSVRDGIMIGERQRIEQENAAQKDQAQGDFYAGRPMDAAQQDDLDYFDTYRSLVAGRTGYDAVQDFNKWYLEDFAPKNPKGDIVAARDQWVKDNLSGAEDPALEGQILAAFYKGSEQTVATHQENAVRIQISQGVDNLKSVIAAEAKAGDFTPDRLAFYVSAARTLDPLNPSEAAPRVAAAVSAAIKLNPDKSISMLSVLQKPGTGVNGKSFAESFPDAYAAVEEKAVSDHMQINTMEALGAVKALDERARKIETMSQDEINVLVSDMIATEHKYGAGSAIDGLMGTVQKALDKRVDIQLNVEHVDAMLNGSPLDVDVMKKYLPTYLKAKGIDSILSGDPAQVGLILAKTNGNIPEDYKAQLSSALMSFNDPATQMKALQLLDVIQHERGVSLVTGSFLNDAASRYFDQVIQRQNSTHDGWDKAAAYVNSLRNRDPKSVPTWAQVFGDTQEKSVAKLNTAINDTLSSVIGGRSWGGLFGDSVQAPSYIRQEVANEVMRTFTEYEAHGILDPYKAITDAVTRMKGRIEVLPSNGGTYMLSMNTDLPPIWMDENGKPQPRVSLGFDVTNPNTGQPVNTVKVYEDELKQVGRSARELFAGDGSVEHVSLDSSYAAANSSGAYAVAHDNPDDAAGAMPIVLVPGTSMKLETRPPLVNLPQRGTGVILPKQMESAAPSTFTDAVVPDTIEGLQELYKDRLPKGFGFVPLPLADGKTGFMLAYRPHFGDEEGMSIQDREKNFQHPFARGK